MPEKASQPIPVSIAIERGVATRSVQTLCEIAAKQYSRRNPWLDYHDLLQEAHIIALSATRTYRTDTGTPLQAYLRSALKRGLWGYTLSQRSVARNAGTVLPHDNEIDPDLPAVANQAELARSAILQALSDNPIAIAVLLAGDTPRAVASAQSMSIESVYAAVAKGRKQIKSSQVCERISEMILCDLYLGEPELLFLHLIGERKYRSLNPITTRNLGGIVQLPPGFKGKGVLAAKLERCRLVWASRDQGDQTSPSLAVRLRSYKARNPSEVLAFSTWLRTTLEQVQKRCSTRIVSYSEALEGLAGNAPRVDGGSPGKSYKDRWETTVVSRTYTGGGECRIAVGRYAYGHVSPGVVSYNTHIVTIQTALDLP